MMENFVAIPCITVIVFLLAELFKLVTKNQKNQFVPVLCGLLGALLGVVCYLWVPEYIAGENILQAIATGIVSGFSATGVHQVYKQTAVGEKKQ